MEELEKGTIIGNLAQDLQMDPKLLFNRKFHMTYDTKIQYFDINSITGTLHITNTIDREELCGSSVQCVIRLGIVMDMPLVLYHIEINILDINDNAPCFKENEIVLAIAESTEPGSHFPLEEAFDPDASSNSVCSYFVSPNNLFDIDAHGSDYEVESLALVLKNALDREQQAIHILTLTANDCGRPKRTGTTQIKILVQDANDNPPVFSESLYRLSIPENYPVGTVLMTLNATDNDDGRNSYIEYSFSSIVPMSVQQVFDIDRESGEIRLRGNIDYEEKTFYELQVRAKDHGQLPLSGHCKVIVEITDVNDNNPEIKVTSLSSIIKEDARPGFVLALFTITDRDSGNNSKVSCKIPHHLPFTLESKFLNYYSLVLKDSLDRESKEEYNILISASDSGSPPLSSDMSITFTVSDVNDNAPVFKQPSYKVIVSENTLPETLILQVSALDGDSNENARLSYSLLSSSIGVKPSSFITIHSDSGEVFLVKSFDYEKIQMFCAGIETKDHGLPSLSSTASLTVFIQDQNDNSPQILPSLFTGEVWRSAQVGHVVTKVKAFDLDSGYNAWLRYEMISYTNNSLFSVELYTGDIIVARIVEETDEDLQNIFIMIKDHGEPPKSAMTVVTITLLQSKEELDGNLVDKGNVVIVHFNSHLIIAISFISSIFLLAAVSYIGVKYVKAFRSLSSVSRPEDYMRNDWTLTESKKRDYNFTPLSFNAQSDYNTTRNQPPPWTYCSADEVLFARQVPEDYCTLRAESEVRDSDIYVNYTCYVSKFITFSVSSPSFCAK
ncbi:protocadherin alpha-4-like [Dendropsophus ebraccatus]|uniref:protocadherin alpha-4-like n=1 Tax=Dendropsophus ebraccatus TaxID=150705 RepID=UPI003831DCBC